MKKTMIFAALCATLITSAANIKVDIDARDTGIKLKAAAGMKGTRAIYAGWAKEQRESYLCFDSTSPASNAWQRYTIAFTPDKSGKIKIALRGSFKASPAADWIAYDDFKVTGCELANPSFEQINSGYPATWFRSSYGFAINADDAPEGKNYIICSHNAFTAQFINVTAGVPVVIDFAAKFDSSTPTMKHPKKVVR